MNTLFLLLGGNLGDKKKLFRDALERLGTEVGKIYGHSSIYETEPWGFESEDMFWNQALMIETTLKPEDVLLATKKIEHDLGRIRKENRYSSRLIDIDILFYSDLVLNIPDLEIPHPRMSERRFVLEPMAELSPKLIHPVFKVSMEELLANCNDPLVVKKLDVRL